MRRNDLKEVIVRFTDGTEKVLAGDDVRVGYYGEYVTMDGEKKDRQEWDTFDIHLSGPKRPVREG